MDVRIREGCFCAGQHAQPVADPQRFLKAPADPRKINVAFWIHPSTFRPEPCCSLSAEHIERSLRDLSFTTWVEQVIDRAQLGGRDPESQDRGALAVAARLGFVVNNLRSGGHELAEFGHLFLQERGL